MTDPAKKVPATDNVLSFVTFPGNEIKDLYVHDVTPEAAPAAGPAPAAAESLPAPPAAKSAAAPAPAAAHPPKPPAAHHQGRDHHQNREGGRGSHDQGRGRHGGSHPRSSAPADGAPRPAPTSAGTGEHLLKMRLKKTEDGTSRDESSKGEFDFQAGLSHFNKGEVLATVASANAADTTKKEAPKYVKDDFFDSLSCDVLDRAEGRSTRLNNQEERALNADTFGAIAVQSNFRRGYRGGGGRGRGGGGGGYHNNNTSNAEGGRGGGGGYRGNRSGGYNNSGGNGNYRSGGRGRGNNRGPAAGAVEA